MFKKNTVFVLGAGASKEFGLPLGSELALRIASAMDVRWRSNGIPTDSGDQQLYEVVKQKTKDQRLNSAAWRIRDGILLSNSIDDFLDLHQNDQAVKELGKAAIVRCILQAERGSPIWIDRLNPAPMQIGKVTNTWAVKLMRMLSPGMSASEPAKVFDNLTFVSFNYDRSLEHFLSHALMASRGCDEAAARKIVDKANIIHPYGIVASLWQDGGIPFGFDEFTDWARYADSISIYTERTEQPEKLASIRTAIAMAEQIVFLGFGFHAQNMRILTPPSQIVGSFKSIFATAIGMSDSDRDIVADMLAGFQPPNYRPTAGSIYVRSDCDCAKLFDEYRLSLPA